MARKNPFNLVNPNPNRKVSKSNNSRLSSLLGNVASKAPFSLVNPNPRTTSSSSSSKNTNLSKSNYYQTPSSSSGSSSNYTNKQNANYYQVPQSSSSSSGGYSESYSGGGGGGGYTVAPIDLSDILNSYKISAEAQKKTIADAAEAQRKILEDTLSSNIQSLKSSESTQRENLLTSLKRFQEDTAQSRKQQQSSFNSNRADLEAQAYMANRQALASAAARGLGGSGLQQLAQLQNLINQGTETSNLAKENTEALNSLAQALARQEQDTTTNLNTLSSKTQEQIQSLTSAQQAQLASLLSEATNKQNEIDANTASVANQLKYQEAVRAENARIEAEQFAQQMAASNASIRANYDSYARQLADEKALNKDALIASLDSALLGADTAFSQASQTKGSVRKKNEAVNSLYNTLLGQLQTNYAAAGINNPNLLNSYSNQLSSLLNKYYQR